jgi:hypothetical protein
VSRYSPQFGDWRDGVGVLINRTVIGSSRVVPVRRALGLTKPGRSQGSPHSRGDTMSNDAVDLGLIARQQKQILGELGSLRNDIAVLTALAMRQDPR